MRRLWSHIIIAATSLLMVGATFATVVTNIDSNMEYASGKELVFRVAARGDDGNPDDSKELNETDADAVKNIASIMEKRLNTADISRYEIDIQGYDTIAVTVSQDSESEYEILRNYLSFNATLAISNSKGTYALAEEFLNPSKGAYMEVTDSYPAIVIPINKDNESFKTVYNEAKEMSDNNTGEVKVEHEHEEGESEEEHEDQFKAYLYLWYDYVEDYYSYDKIDENNSETYNPVIANKVLMTFDAAAPFLDENEDALRAYIGIDTGEVITPESLRTAYQNARYYVNLLNAGEIDSNYTVSYLFSTKADVWVEDLVSLGSHMSINWGSRTIIATICAVIVVSLLLVYFYRLGALSAITTSIVSTFAGLIFIVLFNAEFNIAAVVGIISLAITSIISGIIYLNKLKEECYRGRSLKKANSEAAKKALLPTVDVHVVLVAVGLACYLLGGTIMKGFALATILGGLVSLVVNLIGLRGLLWLVTNEQGLANRYDLFDVSKDQVPNALEEEKQKYYGANADKDFTKSKKPVAIASLVLLVASIAGLVTFGAMNNGAGAVYASSSTVNNSAVYVEYHSANNDNTDLTTKTRNNIDEILDKGYLNGVKLSAISEVESFDYVATYKPSGTSLDTIYYAYYRINFDQPLKADANIVYKDGDVEIPSSVEEFFTLDFLEATSGANLDFDSTVSISLKNSTRINADQPKFTSLILATAVAGAIASAYLLLRYRLSRGLAVLGIATLTVGVSAGIFSLLHFLPVTSYVSVALPLIAMFTFDIAIIFMNKEREMILEERNKDNSLEAREATMKKAIAISSTPITISFIIALYLGVNYFGFMFASVSWIFLLIILGVSFATLMVLVLFGPLSQLLFKWFSKVNISRPTTSKKKKARPVRVKKSAEPEEAIFIGIND